MKAWKCQIMTSKKRTGNLQNDHKKVRQNIIKEKETVVSLMRQK